MAYITTPIYYANAAPHIGSAYTTLAADVFARYWRNCKKEPTFFLTGTDEHGAKIAQSAEAEEKDPQLFVDAMADYFREAWQALDIKPDGFIRTSDPAHAAVVQTVLQKLYDAGHIYEGEYSGWYCVGCEEFKTETQMGPDFTCPIHLTPLKQVSESAYLFKLSAYKEKLVHLIESDQFKVQPETRKNEVLGFLRQDELRDVAISRQNVAWGIPLPWDSSHTIYVWVDALLNYYSASVPSGPDFGGARPIFPPTLQLIGKDILRFHAVTWPALLLAAELPLPKELFVHGYFTIDGHKMSKSLGNIITPQELIDRYGVDGARYVLLASTQFGVDGDVSWEQFDSLYNHHLANNIGNVVSRVQAMAVRYLEGQITLSAIDHTLIASYMSALEMADLSRGLQLIQNKFDAINSAIEQTKPWELAKSNDSQLPGLIGGWLGDIFTVGALLAPYMPDTAEKIVGIFGTSINQINYATLDKEIVGDARTIAPTEPLFPRLSV